ncbi:hypothetical protein ACEPAH_7715 [Sanghuangporus vaninii]
MNVTDQDVAALATTARHLTAAKMFSLACCVMLYFDILITFGDEVEKIWKQRFTFATVLWFMNRYLSPLGYVVIIASFHMDWPKSVCDRYVLYPEILKVFTAAAIGVIFILRLYSIYGGSMVVLVTFSVLLVAELVVKIWAFTDGTSVNLPPGLVGCILTGRGDSNDRFVFTWVAELAFDSIVFIATLSRTFIIYRRHRQGAAIPLIKIMMRDGIIYFLVIFVANVVTMVLFITLPPDLKAVNASFSTLITSLMVSRLILNLRNQAMRPRANVLSYPSSSQQIRTDQEIQTQDRGLTSTVIGNLGQPVETDWFYEAEDDKDEKAPRERDEGDRGRKDTYAMENLKSQRNHTSSSTNESALPVGQIVVEVTQTLSVTTDIHTRTEEDASYPYARPPPHSYPYPYPYRIDGNFRLSHESSREDAARIPDHPSSALPHSLTTAVAQRGLGIVGRLLRPGSSRSVQSAMSASHASQHSREQQHQHQRQHDNADSNENYDAGSSESGHGHGYGRGYGYDRHPYTSSPGTERVNPEGEAEREGGDLEPGARAQVQAQNQTTTATTMEARVRQRGDGGWRPPPTWMLENVDVYELGRPRRSGRSSADRTRRRPSTS